MGEGQFSFILNEFFYLIIFILLNIDWNTFSSLLLTGDITETKTMKKQEAIIVRPEVRLDAKWLKTELHRFLCQDGLAELWNEMIRDGEIIGPFSDGMVNSAGVVAKKGYYYFHYFNYQLFRLIFQFHNLSKHKFVSI